MVKGLEGRKGNLRFTMALFTSESTTLPSAPSMITFNIGFERDIIEETVVE